MQETHRSQVKVRKVRSSRIAELTRTENQILASLPRSERDRIQPTLKPVTVNMGTILHEPDQALRAAYFVNSGMVSLLAIMGSDKTAEVGLIGKEGVLGSPIILGSPKSTRRAITQAPLSAYCMPAKDFLQAFQELPVFNALLLKYVRAQVIMMSQLAACNGLHSVEQRLARWLLMCHDRVGSETLSFTHEFLAEMLGVKRSTITEIARPMLRAGLIDYSRGKITILKLKELQRISCECYRVIKDQYAQLLDS
jgi:CRP-like cAMP-binding protein